MNKISFHETITVSDHRCLANVTVDGKTIDFQYTSHRHNDIRLSIPYANFAKLLKAIQKKQSQAYEYKDTVSVRRPMMLFTTPPSVNYTTGDHDAQIMFLGGVISIYIGNEVLAFLVKDKILDLVKKR